MISTFLTAADVEETENSESEKGVLEKQHP